VLRKPHHSNIPQDTAKHRHLSAILRGSENLQNKNAINSPIPDFGIRQAYTDKPNRNR